MTNAPRSFDQVPKAQGYIPILGHTVSLLGNLPKIMNAVRTGNNKFQRLQIPGSYDIYIWDDLKVYDLFKSKNTTTTHFVEMVEIITGRTSMMNSDGAEHRRHRKITERNFTPKGLNMVGVTSVIREVLTDRIARMVKQPEVVILEETRKIALDIIFRMMGIPVEDLGLWEKNYSALVKAMPWPNWSFPGSPYKRAVTARTWIDERLKTFIDRARGDSEMTGLIAEFVRGQDSEGNFLSEEEILDNLRIMAFAGHESSAAILAWMMSYAATDSGIQDRLMVEALASDELPKTPQEMSNFPYAEALFRECLRFHPTTPLTSRRLTEPMVIEGYSVPEGTVVGIPIWLISREPSLYHEPDRFNPERWLGLRHGPTTIENIAFGGGSHFCLGYHMAWVEAVQFIVILMRTLHASGLRMEMQKLPKETYFPILRPRMKDTRCIFR